MVHLHLHRFFLNNHLYESIRKPDCRSDISILIEYPYIHGQTRKAQEISCSKPIDQKWNFIGANVREAQACQSNRDFVAKLKIAEKEMEETQYWVDLCQHSEVLPDPDGLAVQLSSIKKVLGKILSTCYRNGYNQ